MTVGTPTEKNSIKKPVKQIRVQLYSDFKCDHCGSRYVVNPMRRGNKVSVSKYKAAPRHKIDPETQKILTLCNACGEFVLHVILCVLILFFVYKYMYIFYFLSINLFLPNRLLLYN